jgi:hypothetical protein
MTEGLYTDATCSAASFTSTDKLHERVCAPLRSATGVDDLDAAMAGLYRLPLAEFGAARRRASSASPSSTATGSGLQYPGLRIGRALSLSNLEAAFVAVQHGCRRWNQVTVTVWLALALARWSRSALL